MRTPQGECFLSFPLDGGGRHNCPLRSETAGDWLGLQFYLANNHRPIPDVVVTEATNTLCGQGRLEGTEQEVHIRVGEHAGSVLVDLGAGSTAGRFELRRDPGPSPSGVPSNSGPPDLRRCRSPPKGRELAELQGTPFDSTINYWRLVLAFNLNCLNPKGPYMHLLVEGEQGSGKSVLCNFIKQTIDPNAVGRLRLPRTEIDLMIQANENRLLVFDNASTVKADMSDAVCALATNSGFSTRKYYTDNQSRTFMNCRPVIINGIGEFASRPDLIERCIGLRLPAMPRGTRRTEAALTAEFERIRPGILGCLYDAVAHALARRDEVEPPTSIRMAETAHWLAAAEGALGFEPGTFVAALEANQTDMMSERVTNDPLMIAIRQYVESCHGRVFHDTVGDLLARSREPPNGTTEICPRRRRSSQRPSSAPGPQRPKPVSSWNSAPRPGKAGSSA